MLENVKLYMIRILINFLVLALLGGALYLITFTAEQMIEVNIWSVTWIMFFRYNVHADQLIITITLVLELQIKFPKINGSSGYSKLGMDWGNHEP